MLLCLIYYIIIEVRTIKTVYTINYNINNTKSTHDWKNAPVQIINLEQTVQFT